VFGTSTIDPLLYRTAIASKLKSTTVLVNRFISQFLSEIRNRYDAGPVQRGPCPATSEAPPAKSEYPPPPVLALQFNSRAKIRLHERFQ